MTWTKLQESVGQDLRTELIKKSTGVVRQVIMMAHPDASDDDLINIVREDFSDALTMNEAPGGAAPHAPKTRGTNVRLCLQVWGTCIRGRQALGQLKRHTSM